MQTSNVSDLKTRLKEKMDSDRQQTESLMSEQLQQLTKNLKASAKAEQLSISKSMATGFKEIRKEIKTEIEATEAAADLSEIRTQTENMISHLSKTKTTLTKIYLWIIGLIMLLAVITGASMYGLTWWYQNRLQRTLDQTATAEETLALIEQRTFGMEIIKSDEKGGYILFGPKWKMEKNSEGGVVLYGQGREGILLQRR